MTFILSKLFWVFCSPANLLVLLLLLGVFLASAKRKKMQSIGHKICFDVAVVLFFLAVFPVGDWLLTPLENRFELQKPATVDGILILGGDEKPALTEKRGVPVYTYQSAQRYIAFAALARQYPKAKLVFTGGSSSLSPQSSVKDAEVAKEVLASLGVPVERMIFEDASRNTYENAVFTADLVKPEPKQNWLLVTSAWHMARSMSCFRKAGWNVFAAPTGYLTSGKMSLRPQLKLEDHLMKITLAVHEYVGLAAYRLLGYTDALWPQ